MKKNILIIAALSLAMLVRSQNTEYAFLRYKYFWGYFDNSYVSKENKQKLVDEGVNGLTKTTVYTKGKKQYVSSKILYDKNGNSTSCTFYKKNGQPRSTYVYEFNSDNLITSQSYKKGEENERQKLTVKYDQLDNATEEAYYKKSILKSKTVSKYDSTRVLESYFYRDGYTGYYKKWVYTYYPDHSKKSSVIYDAKGKVLYTWNYDCKPEGELQNKHKDTTNVCKKTDYDSTGNKIVTIRKFNEKGKAYKVVIIYDKNDKIIQYFSYNPKGQLTYTYKYNTGGENISEIINYKNGKVTYKYLYSYDANNNLISTAGYRKGEQVNRSEYKYNSRNLIVSLVWYGKNDKLYETSKYDYTFF